MSDTTPTLGFLLHDVARLLRKRFEQRARNLGLTRAQWQVLAYLSTNEGIHQGGLAELIDVEPITLVPIVDKLQARGLVERRQNPRDRRCWQLHLTEAAHPLLAVIRGMGETTRNEALQGFSEPVRRELLQLLAHMKENLVMACNTPIADEERKHG